MQYTLGHSKNSAGKKLRDTNTPLPDPQVKVEISDPLRFLSMEISGRMEGEKLLLSG